MEGNNGNFGLAINNEVIARMVSVAALEVEGVAGMAKSPRFNKEYYFSR